MKTVFPDYYGKFQCIGGKCRHSCCIGWEIDIDQDTLAYYRSVSSEFGNRLEKSIAVCQNTAYFTLDEKERCPFLNDAGLCDIILTLGENRLCQICRDHPRFRNVFTDRVEIGLGLCCEEACRLILTDTEPMFLTESGISNCEITEDEMYFHSWRSQLLSLAQNRSHSIEERVSEILSFCQMQMPKLTSAEWAQIYENLTVLNESWLSHLSALKNNTRSSAWYTPEWDTAWEQLIVYFLYRHLPDGITDNSLPERAAFAILSFRIIRDISAAISSTPNWDTLLNTARLYSAEIEYAEENMTTLLELLYDENIF